MERLLSDYLGWEISKVVNDQSNTELVLEPPYTANEDLLPVILAFTSVKAFHVSYDLISSKAVIKRETDGFEEIESGKGHDSFLLDVPNFLGALKNFLDKSYDEN